MVRWVRHVAADFNLDLYPKLRFGFESGNDDLIGRTNCRAIIKMTVSPTRTRVLCAKDAVRSALHAYTDKYRTTSSSHRRCGDSR